MDLINFEVVADEHLSFITALYNDYIRNTTITFHKKELAIEDMKKIIYHNNPRYVSYVIYYQGNLCGYCILGQYRDREAYEDCGEVAIYLDRPYWHKGIGSASIDFLEAKAKANKFHVLLSAISGENKVSIQLFEKKGYTQCAHFKEIGKKFDKVLDVIYYQKIL
ncbi:phosphinothricin acetyltransferase [Natranaerovirga hydrolytica]|uniref:Phosphinothricin acetyltransferase n=1 Tax=Natranaerovirga hydrolytica TaxID=680378 RepID=A0A4R1MYH2_9FIRM|nr:GNAT family N-acetyltransferase [Natranaerovirga hydrolytica]TCK98185.1 phosphinothricin acetyltransferase [Natranaerovirga hydrolytica]